MSILDAVIRESVNIEALLRKIGAEGSTFREVTESVKDLLGHDLKSRIDKIRLIRNDFAHGVSYEYKGDEIRLLEEIETVLSELNAIHDKDSVKKQQSRQYQVNTNGDFHMSETDKPIWVETLQKELRGNYFYSDNSQRIVAFTGTGIKIIPAGKTFRVPIVFSKVEKIFRVRMTPGLVDIRAPGGIKSRDAVELDLKITALIKVADKPDAIERIALDASSELRMVYDHILSTFQSVIASWNYVGDVEELKKIGDRAVQQALSSFPKDLGFKLVRFTKTNIDSADHVLKQLGSDKVKAEATAELNRIKREIEREELLAHTKASSDIAVEKVKGDVNVNFIRGQGEIELTGEQNRATLEHASKIADLENKLKDIDQERILRALREKDGKWAINPEAAKSIELALINHRTEVAKAIFDGRTELNKLKIAGALTEGELKALQKVLQNTKYSNFKFVD